MLRFSLSATLFLLPGLASAQVYIGNSRYGAGAKGGGIERQQSPQNFALEVKVAPYLPPLDNDPALGGETPFTDIFGDQKALMGRISLEYQALRLGPFASIGAGVGIGAYQKKGFGLDDAGQPTEDANLFRVIPLSANAVLRFDYLQSFGVPFVPFAKAGFDYYYWSNKKNGEFTRFPNGAPVQGGTMGFHANLGLALNLNVLDPSGGISMDQSFGINNSYLFAELEVSQINDFGAGGFDFSSSFFDVGLAFEF